MNNRLHIRSFTNKDLLKFLKADVTFQRVFDTIPELKQLQENLTSNVDLQLFLELKQLQENLTSNVDLQLFLDGHANVEKFLNSNKEFNTFLLDQFYKNPKTYTHTIVAQALHQPSPYSTVDFDMEGMEEAVKELRAQQKANHIPKELRRRSSSTVSDTAALALGAAAILDPVQAAFSSVTQLALKVTVSSLYSLAPNPARRRSRVAENKTNDQVTTPVLRK